jgi:catechol 2,3-dioxygenase-like lactoylglutathione lyase family enzyme
MVDGITKLGHIGLGVRDLDAAVDFYCGILGLELSERLEYPSDEVGHGTRVHAGAFVRCSSTHHCISLFAMRSDAPVEHGAYGLHHIAFEMESKERLIDAYHELRRRGVPIVAARKGGPGNQPRFYARDPEGNLLEFYWGIDQIGWDGIPRAYEPIQDIDLDEFDFEDFVAGRREAARESQGRVQAGQHDAA